jgi:hypothetical protein
MFDRCVPLTDAIHPWAEGTLVDRRCATSAAIGAATKAVTTIVTKTTPRGLRVNTLGVKPCGRCDSVSSRKAAGCGCSHNGNDSDDR